MAADARLPKEAPTRRCREREPANSPRDKSNVIGGLRPSLTITLGISGASLMITSRTRIVSATVAQCLAIVSFFTAPWVFSGDAERYAKHVATQNGHLVVAGALTAIALVVSVPVCWRGNNLQRLVAVVPVSYTHLTLPTNREV